MCVYVRVCVCVCIYVCMYIIYLNIYQTEDLTFIVSRHFLSCLQLQQLITEMKDIYSRARICPHSFSSTNYNYRHSGSCDLALDPGKTNSTFLQTVTENYMGALFVM